MSSEITTVTSPFEDMDTSDKLFTLLLTYSSWNLVISLQIRIFLLKKCFFIGSIILLIFFGDIKKTIEKFIFETEVNNLFNSFFFSGKKPQNKYLSENPLTDIAAPTAEGPGTE